jgi:hypothetical protein
MAHQVSASEREAVLRRAIIRVKPEYFAWPVADQECYRVCMPEQDAFRMEQAVVRSLFALQVETPAQLSAAMDTFTPAQYLQFNSTMLPLQGIGEDHFFLNECFGDKSLLDFVTLYEYDSDDHCFQEQVRQNEDSQYTAKPYQGNLFHRWARLRIDGAFYYATLSSAASYLYSRVEDVGCDMIEELIPHTYVASKEHGKREGTGIRWDRRIDAGGMEAQLEELRHRFWHYLFARHEALLQEFDAAAKRVYFYDESQPDDPQMHIVFSDQTALQAVRLRHFVRDCRGMAGDPQELEAWAERECQAMRRFLEQACQDILQHFDPKVTKLRKKRHIILADRAVKDLLSITSSQQEKT